MRNITHIAITAAIVITLNLLAGCAANWEHEHYRPIIGDWETQRGIIMTIIHAPGRGASASMKLAPGYESEGLQIGDALITNIKPLAGGGYRGIFVMPEGEKPVKVKLGLISRDTLMIITWDKRAGDRTMKWKRVKKQSGENG